MLRKYCIAVWLSLSLFSSVLSAEEKTRLVFLYKYNYSSENNFSNTISNNTTYKGQNYNLSLWGVGIKQKIEKNMDCKFSIKSLLNYQKVAISNFVDLNNNINDSQDFNIVSFREITFGADYTMSIKEKLFLVTGIDINYYSGHILRDIVGSERRWTIGTFYDLSAGINYQFVQRANIGVNILYDTRKSMEFKIEGNDRSRDITLDVNPIVIETVFSLSF